MALELNDAIGGGAAGQCGERQFAPPQDLCVATPKKASCKAYL